MPVSRFHSYLNSAKKILSVYKGEDPFASFLKKYFAQNKKFGSKDRKQIAHLCYCYFRSAPPSASGGGIKEAHINMQEKILTGLFLCSFEPNEMLEAIKQEWNEIVQLSLAEKFSFINYQLSSVFPWKEELSEGIEHEKFCESFFQQPDLFLRLRPGKEELVKQKLQKARIDFKIISDSCLALDNTIKIDTIIELNKEAVVQDYNSQQIGRFLGFALATPRNDKPAVWDCCAGSGGKSIMLFDINSGIELTVSDIRKTILINLKKRFERAGIKNYNSLVIDLGEKNIQHSIINNPRLPDGQEQSIIIADVPCTGSGTWGRTPEQLFYFNNQTIGQFSNLQKKIISNITPHLQTGGYLLYITCSVFKKENEEVVEYIREKFNLELQAMEILKGYDKKADTMFAALLKKAL